MPPDLLLRTENLAKRYGRRTAVDGISIEVRRGDIFGFLGPNGAGKTTTIRMILGLIRPSAGRVELLGYEMPAGRRRALVRVGAIVDTPAFYGALSARANLELFAALAGGATRAQVDQAIRRVGLAGREGDPVRAYSYGMRQRLGLAQALLPDPELILLDEPSLGLDPRGMKEMRDLILDLNRTEGLTICLSSHLLAEVQQVCNRIAIIDRGRLRFQGEVGRLLEQRPTWRLRATPADTARAVVEEFVAGGCGGGERAAAGGDGPGPTPGAGAVRGEDGALLLELAAEAIPEVNARLVARGVRVYEITPLSATLEDVFLKLTDEPAGAGAR
ncbi:MAG: ABC transporter ATP-binding protein [Planctomycetes bacterium]|nr:ABC transporter ATP-binding protein [Planctomycetota bacterium]